ncbi:MAG: hypothetical protein P4L50_17660 [Anaerolineaceae bacterium]|nr:hypothetical protein [Anaerolineaceae bacterium]
MGYQWSRNAAHIQSLFQPWNSEDGWDESSVHSAEQAISIRFPFILRNYYLSWGKRVDFNRSNEILLDPKDTFERHGHLVFCIENQAVYFWGIPLNQLGSADPPVNFIYNDETDITWKPSHKLLTSFLDALLYNHAFTKGAAHGATIRVPFEKWNSAEQLVRSSYQKLQLDSMIWGIRPSEDFDRWTLYIADGIAVDISFISIGLFAVARDMRSLQDLESLLSLPLEEVW